MRRLWRYLVSAWDQVSGSRQRRHVEEFERDGAKFRRDMEEAFKRLPVAEEPVTNGAH